MARRIDAGLARKAVALLRAQGLPAEAVLARAGLDTATLSRKGARMGRSFKVLVDELRRELARRYLEQGVHRPKSIAALLGLQEFERVSSCVPALDRDDAGAISARTRRRLTKRHGEDELKVPAWRTPSFGRYLPTSVRLPPRHGRPRPRILRTAPSVVRFISHTGSCISGAGIATVMLIRPLERPTEPALGRCDLASVSRGLSLRVPNVRGRDAHC